MNLELNDFQKFREFIKDFIINDEDLFKTIFYSYSSPTDLDLPDDPYSIFPEDNPNLTDELTNEHGVVLFRRKYDQVQSREGITILINYYTAPLGNDPFLDSLFITFRLILKGTNVQTLSDGSSRHGVIARGIINNFHMAKVNNLDYVQKISYKDLSLNEENSGSLLTFSCASFSHKQNENKNYVNGMRKKW